MNNRSILALLCVLSCILAGQDSQADTFRFHFNMHGYPYGAVPYFADGTFDGVENGAYIENISNVTLGLAGNPNAFFNWACQIDGPIDALRWGGNGWVQGSVVSYNKDLCNFLFVGTSGEVTGYFGMVKDLGQHFLSATFDGNTYSYYPPLHYVSNMIIEKIAVTSPVPDRSPTLLLLFSVLVALAISFKVSKRSPGVGA